MKIIEYLDSVTGIKMINFTVQKICQYEMISAEWSLHRKILFIDSSDQFGV